MIKEKKSLILIRLTSFFICLLLFFMPSIKDYITNIDLRILSVEGKNEYLESIDESICEVYIKINKDVTLDYDSKFIVEFYDVNNESLGVYESGYLDGYGNIYSCTFFDIPGEAVSYVVLSYDIESFDLVFCKICWILCFIALVFFIDTFTLCYKRYLILGYDVIVYAGVFNHYIKINGLKADENNTIIMFSPLYMRCALDREHILQVRITIFNRISLQCNNVLVQPNKFI